MANERSVRHDEEVTWVEGVPTLGWGRGRECTFAGALEAAIRPTDFPCGYSAIMGMTGLAFRTRWFCGNERQRWCPSCAVGEMPEEIGAATTATGWPLRAEFLDVADHACVRRIAESIVASIDAGLPVLAYESNLNMDVIYGYQDRGRTLLLRDYFKGDEPLHLAPDKLGFLLLFLGEHIDPLPCQEAVLEGLCIAVRSWRRERFATGPGEYWYGDAALQHWTTDLGEENLSQGERTLLHGVSWWNASTLLDARKAAVTFLPSAALGLSQAAIEALNRTVELYRNEVELFSAALQSQQAFVRDIAAWTPEVRRKEQEVLRTAQLIETAAVMQIEKVVEGEAAVTDQSG
jgi:hypothetical protein